MLKGKPVIGILPSYPLNETENPYDYYGFFITLYSKHIIEAGGIPIGLVENKMDEYLDLCDGYLWPGGKRIWRDFFPVVEDAIKNKKPILGVCMGMQSLSLYFMLKEEQANYPDLTLEEIYQMNKNTMPYIKKVLNEEHHLHETTLEQTVIDSTRHIINIKENTLLNSIFNTTHYNGSSMHRYEVARIAKDLVVNAISDDGVTEGIEYTKDNNKIIGVQWHPDIEPNNNVLFEWLVRNTNPKYQILINKENKLEDAQFNIARYDSECPLNKDEWDVECETKNAFLAFKKFALDNNIIIDIDSAFRTHEIFDKFTKEKGIEHVARAGSSEHESGLAIDIAIKINDTWYNSYESILDESYQFLHEHCAEFGFILRYPKNKEEITGYSYEPWHFRYLGNISLAKYIMKNNLTLEEYKRN